MKHCTYQATRAQHAADERRVAGKLPATASSLNSDLAARMSSRQAADALKRLCADGRATFAGRPALYSLTDAGRAWLAAPAERPSLPVLPPDASPAESLACGRRGVVLTVAQCAASWASRGQDACSRDAEGKDTKGGCPVGAQCLGIVRAAGDKRAA